MKQHRSLYLLLTVLVVAGALMFTSRAAWAQSSNSQMLTLAGYKLNPSVTTSGSGTVTLTVRNDSLIVEGSFSDLTSQYVSSGIYYALQNRAFNQIFRFSTELNEQWTGGKIPAADNRFPLSETLKEMLRNGELSVRIMTNGNKQGEIGAQISVSS